MTLGSGLAQIFLPKGFFAAGINSGVRKYRPDLGLIYSEVPATTAAVFTQSTLVGAHVDYCQKLLPSEKIQAIITNSGQANTSTGKFGAIDNQAMVDTLARALKINGTQVLTASTGVVGKRLEIDKIVEAIPNLVQDQITSAQTFATAIMTTDLVPKAACMTVELSQGTVTLTGVAKGSGMIHPNMATMLGYLFTDLKLTAPVAQELLKRCSNKTFNMISVDGETSPNDTVFFMANGAAKVSLANDQDYNTFLEALEKMSTELAKSIVRDGEGATKLIQVDLVGAPNQEKADQWARSLTTSPLVKTAIHGNDPNWGRIISRLGAEQVPKTALAKLNLDIQGLALMENGEPVGGDLQELQKRLKTHEIKITIDLNSGDYKSTAWGCDLSKKYVEINAEYMT
jgi:glutamate N-acetyltransferase / amino-acid N-acetyltransferase